MHSCFTPNGKTSDVTGAAGKVRLWSASGNARDPANGIIMVELLE